MFKLNYARIKLSRGDYNRLLYTHMRDLLAYSAFTWLNAAVAAIPVWSGASHGTFLKLAAEIGYDIQVSGTAGDNPFALGPEEGRAQSKGFLTLGKGSGQYTFTYETTLWHLIYNEYNNANQNPTEGRLFARLKRPGPYDFQAQALEAWNKVAANAKLPSPWEVLRLSWKTVG
ncbi:MAG: hypothetical protein AMXMBFR16_10320 [Candidatus Uhrbacteria bacterium]